MFESREHHELVLRGKAYIERTFPELSNVYFDDYAPLGTTVPLQGIKHRPDIIGINDDVLVFGEAKTDNDALSKHSVEQYDEYLIRCSLDQRKCYLLVFVSWRLRAAVRDLLRVRCERLNLSTVNWRVISEIELLGQAEPNAKN